MANLINNILPYFVNSFDEYEICIYFGNINIYKFFTSKNISQDISQETEIVYGYGSIEPLDIYKTKRQYSFSIDLQDGEYQLLVNAARLGLLNININSVLDFPDNTTFLVLNKTNGSTFLYQNCVFGSDKYSISVGSPETITQLEFKCINFKRIF
jgi:hypothetical protein